MVILDTLLGLCICKFDSERISASPATNLTARYWSTCIEFLINRGNQKTKQHSILVKVVTALKIIKYPEPIGSLPTQGTNHNTAYMRALWLVGCQHMHVAAC